MLLFVKFKIVLFKFIFLRQFATKIKKYNIENKKLVCYYKGGDILPVISQFYGILIYIYIELGGHHHKPHIHAKYGEYEISITLDGERINGNMPAKQLKLILAWMEIHKDELNAAWYAYNNDGEIIKIKGLE